MGSDRKDAALKIRAILTGLRPEADWQGLNIKERLAHKEERGAHKG